MSEGAPKSGGAIKLAAAVLAVVVIVLLAVVFDAQSVLKNALQWIEDQGPLGALVFFALYVTATVAFLPGSILTLGAGAVYGLVKGMALVSVSSTVGAGAAFLVGRYLARDWIAQKISQYPRFKAVDDAVAREGWKIVALARLSPLFPFNFLNYAFGLTKIGFWPYLLTSWIAMVPGTLMFVYIGSAIGQLATLGDAERERSPLEWAFFGVGLAATVAVTVHVTRIARQALGKRVAE